MKKNITKLLILCFFISTVFCGIGVDLQRTQATLYTNDRILLKFKVLNATVPFTIKFTGIPNNWDAISNDLVISNVTSQMTQEWAFDIAIADRDGNKLSQTVKLKIKDYYITIVPVTLALVQSPNGIRSVAAAGKINTNTNSNFASVFNLTDLINRYPGIKQSSSGANGLGKNAVASSIITPLIISTSQAAYNPERDARQISPYEIKRNAAIYRQNNANKAIANLLFIIQNLKTSINDAKNNLSLEENRYQYMKDSSFNCSQNVFNLEDKIAKIKNAIDDRKTKVDQQKIQITSASKNLEELRNKSMALNSQKFEIQSAINPEGHSLIQAEKRIIQCESKIKLTTTQIENIRNTIRSNKLQINVATDNMEDSNKKLKTVDMSLDIVRQTIVDLKRQLAQAQDQQLGLMKDQIFYSSVPVQNRIKIQNLQRKNTDLEAQAQNLTAKTITDQQACDQNKDGVRLKKDAISQRQQNYSTILREIDTIKNKSNFLEAEIKLRNSNSDNLTVQINALSKELEKSSLSLTQQKYICAVAQDKKIKQKAKLDQIAASINENSKALDQSGKYLQMARAQKELADMAIQEIIRSSTNVTMYPIVPNGGSTILGGNPLGNNPSGSALGPSFRVNSIEKGSLDIQNLTKFLSTVYEMNIDPTDILKSMASEQRPASPPTTTLYPLDTQSRTQIVNNNQIVAAKDSKCSGSSTINRSGFIEQVTLGSIIVRDNFNQKYTLSVSFCTRIASTKAGNFFASGNKVYFTGVQLFNVYSNTIVDAYSILIVP